MPLEKIIHRFPPPRDPRDPSVNVPAATDDIPDPPRELFPRDPEAPSPSGLRLHLAEEAYDALTPEQVQTLDIDAAVSRLIERYGATRVRRVVSLALMARGEKLG
jgi:hypothetical protein